MDEIGESYAGSGDSAAARMQPEKRATPVAKTGKLDSPEVKRMHARLVDWLREERDRQSVNRMQMAIDEDFYDGLQWQEDDAAELIARGQAPLVFNKIKPTINWLLGTEKRTRFDYKILPREEDDVAGAEVKTKVFKYLSDCNRLPFERSQAFKEQVCAGLGWLEEGVNNEPGQELIYTGAESWRNVLHDSMATKLDLSDGRFQFRWRWMDLDVAEAMFPNRKSVLRAESMNADEVVERDEEIWYLGARTSSDIEASRRFRHRAVAETSSSVFNRRQRVKVLEGWYRVPTQCQVMRGGGSCDGEVYDARDAKHIEAVQSEEVTLATTMLMKMRVMLFTESHPLWSGDSPYRHNRFPLTPLWCYRRARDGQPYGAIRDIRDPQEDYNKRSSKALFILSTNRVIMDKGAIDAKDLERFRQEVARPDGIIEKKANSELTIAQNTELGEEHLTLADRDGQLIQDVAGVTDENLGRRTNATSGIAIERRQLQGSVVTAGIFDNLRFAFQVSGEKILSLAEQFMTAKRVLRIVGDNKPIEWLKINHVDENGQPLNDITANRADFIVDAQDFHATLRQAMFEELMDMLGKIAPVMPEAAINLLDLVVGMSDVPAKDEFVARIRKINGQRDPSKAPTPEEQAQQQRNEAMAQEQQKLMLDKLRAEVTKLQAQGKQLDATAFTSIVTGLYESLQAAQIVATVPNVAPVADVIAMTAGLKPQAGTDPNIPQPPGTLPAMTPQPLHGSYVGAAGGIGPSPELQQADGAATGIETLGNDGVS